MNKRYAGAMEPLANPEFEARITAALERRAEPAIPENFAARVTAALPPLRPARRRVSAGRWAAIGAGVTALAGIVLLAPHAAPSFSSIAFDAELLLTAELAAIASWLALPGRQV